MSKNRNALGRGLGAILKETDEPAKERVAERADSVNKISIESITEVNPFQPRNDFEERALQELADSIAIHGIIQPITVRKLEPGKYQIISGERRFRASKLAGLKEVPVYVREADDKAMLEMALIENIQRENLNAIEVALSYQRLIAECNLKQEELGDRVSKNRSTVTNYLRLLKLPPDIQIGIRDNKISMGHARAIIGIEDTEKQLYVFRKTVEEELSVRQTEELVRKFTAPKEKKASEPAKAMHPEYKNLQTKLCSHFGTKVHVKADEKNKGEITIPFVSKEDLNRILELINV